MILSTEPSETLSINSQSGRRWTSSSLENLKACTSLGRNEYTSRLKKVIRLWLESVVDTCPLMISSNSIPLLRLKKSIERMLLTDFNKRSNCKGPFQEQMPLLKLVLWDILKDLTLNERSTHPQEDHPEKKGEWLTTPMFRPVDKWPCALQVVEPPPRKRLRVSTHQEERLDNKLSDLFHFVQVHYLNWDAIKKLTLKYYFNYQIVLIL